MAALTPHDLFVVMPVYNEEACILDVIEAWRNELSQLQIDHLILVLNDGSRDNTQEKLLRYQDDDRVVVINKENSGHGPTILGGYGLAAANASWVFQTDSDDEMSPLYFQELWRRRDSYDALFGIREARKQGLGRKTITAISRITVRLLFSSGVTDVNTPYRLIRAGHLNRMVRLIPADTFAPNVIISGALSTLGARIYNHPVPHQGRKTGQVSIVKLKLWKAAARSLLQTLAFGLKYGKNL